jgi:hypothetical protein
MSFSRKLWDGAVALVDAGWPIVFVIVGAGIGAAVAQINSPSALQVPMPPLPTSPAGVQATSITGSATGTTASIAVTLAGTAGKTTYLCGYKLTADATAATEGNATITGIVTGTATFRQSVANATNGTAETKDSFWPCIAASAPNTSITINSVAAGTGGNAAGYASGFQF